jgi:hypothetical protein
LKIFRNTIAFFVVLTLLNVVLGKAFHEFFEHKHEVHECEFSGTIHFHETEFTHFDFLCNFNFSASLITELNTSFDGLVQSQNIKVKIHFLGLTKNLCNTLISLRGPPAFFYSTIIF